MRSFCMAIVSIAKYRTEIFKKYASSKEKSLYLLT